MNACAINVHFQVNADIATSLEAATLDFHDKATAITCNPIAAKRNVRFLMIIVAGIISSPCNKWNIQTPINAINIIARPWITAWTLGLPFFSVDCGSLAAEIDAIQFENERP